MVPQAAITFKNIRFQSNQTTILHTINGSISSGKITTLIGPSGAGKTTLLKLCNGLISATDGSILIHGKPLEDYEPTALRRHVGIALQSAPMLRTSVYKNLALPKTLQQQILTKQQALESLQAVGLSTDILHREVSELSGGQKQRLSIARTLINQSEILLLDEITSALDPKSVHEIEELIVQLNEKYGVTIIWITHNIEQAKQLGHYTWFMKDGHLIAADETAKLFASDQPIIQQFLRGGAAI